LTTYRLSNYLREEFQRPLGVVISNGELDGYVSALSLKNETLVTVGDRTTDYFVAHRHRPRLQIVDAVEKRSRRTPPVGGYDRQVGVSNPAGGITSEAMEAIRLELGKEGATRMLVMGEEDLLVLPVILFAEDGTDVFYGQPNVGMVHVRVNGSYRRKASGMLAQMGYTASPR
jgi:uncharacterized protein (UPF0218 family)